ncbi:MAG: hypothetical protein M3Y56_09690 [Armatimonadota bacterium]|nr:hypothetical protein [Armatimonadota bacterium]
MSFDVIEGTWEEVERHKAELLGRQLRVTILPDRPASQEKSISIRNPAATVPAKKLTGFGAFKDSLPSTEDYFREKREDTIREDRANE